MKSPRLTKIRKNIRTTTTLYEDKNYLSALPAFRWRPLFGCCDASGAIQDERQKTVESKKCRLRVQYGSHPIGLRQGLSRSPHCFVRFSETSRFRRRTDRCSQ